MKLTRDDLKALRFSIFVMQSLLDVCSDPTKRPQLKSSISHVRKVHIMLLAALAQNTLDFSTFVLTDFPPDSQLAKNVNLLCGGL
jgi:hypothetical protein